MSSVYNMPDSRSCLGIGQNRLILAPNLLGTDGIPLNYSGDIPAALGPWGGKLGQESSGVKCLSAPRGVRCLCTARGVKCL